MAIGKQVFLNIFIYLLLLLFEGYMYKTIWTIVIVLFYVVAMSGQPVNLNTLFQGRLRPPKRLTHNKCTHFRPSS